MKTVKRVNSKRIIGMLLVAILFMTGCSSTSCENCDRKATKECYNVNDSEDVRYFCDIHCPSCDVCMIQSPLGDSDAVRFKVTTGTMYFCNLHDYQDVLQIFGR